MEEYLKNPFYQSNYCEENIRLLSEVYLKLEGKNGFICFITNKLQQVPIWYQKKCLNEQEPVVWDYHVIFLCPSQDNNLLLVYDFDTTMSLPVHWIDYVTNAFQPHLGIKEKYLQCLRVVPIETFIEYFASDRSHMYSKENNTWLSEPPTWPIIRGRLASTSHNLMDYLVCDKTINSNDNDNNCDNNCDNDNNMKYGILYKLSEFIEWCNELENSLKSSNIDSNNHK